MTCREFAEFLDAYLAGTLLAEQAEVFRNHLSVCVDCVAYMDTYRRTVDACHQLGASSDSVPSEVPEELIAAILAARRRQA